MTRGTRVVVGLGLLGAPELAFAQNFGTNGNSCNFATLQAAVTAAGAGGTVWVRAATHTITSTVTVSASVIIAGANANCVAGSAGRATLDKSGGGQLFIASNGAVLTLDEIDAEEGSTGGGGGTILLNTASDLTLQNATVSGGFAASDGGCIYATNDSVVELLDGSRVFDCISQDDGGNIALDFGAELYVDDSSEVTDGFAADDGGNIMAAGNTVTTLLGEVDFGEATGSGGGIALVCYNGGSPVLELTGDVTDNEAGSDGGGIWVDPVCSGTSITLIAGSQIMENVADNGGGIYLGDGTLDVDGSQVDTAFVFHNEATASGTGLGGGGIYATDAVISGDFLEVYDNQALTAVGGGIHAVNTTVDLVNSRFAHNEAGHGGGMVVDSGDLTLDADYGDCTPAIVAGEWLYCSSVDQNVSLGSVGSGRTGGIQIANGTAAVIENTGFRGNYSQADGGALVVSGATSTAEVRNCLFDDNEFVALPNSAALVVSGDLQIYASTFWANATPITWLAGTGQLHRSAFDGNTNDPVFVAGITGACNVAQTVAGLPTGAQNVAGDALLDSFGHPTVNSALVIDQCNAGPANDILGNARTDGQWDRGAVERP